MVDPSREGEEEARDPEEAAQDADADEHADVSTPADVEAGAAPDVEGDEDADGEAAGADAAPAEAEAVAGSPEDERTQPGITAPSAGTLLREAREARGIALEDLARTLNLHPTVVTALERDDDEALPSAPFVRGYLRSYARLVGMDPTSLLQDHDRRTGGVVVEVRPSHRLEEPIEGPGFVHKRPGTIMIIATVGFIAVVVGALLLLRPEAFDLPAAPSDEDQGAAAAEAAAPPAARRLPATPSRAPAIAPVIEALEDPLPPGPAEGEGADAALSEGGEVDGDAAPEPAAEAEPGPDAGAAAAAEAEVPDPDASGAADDGILRTRSADGNVLRVYAGGEDHLHFAFTEDCWVEVLDGDDVSVFQDIVRDGEVLDLWGRAPFRIRLGYAPAVELTYNGSRVALRPFTRNDVASLTLGR